MQYLVTFYMLVSVALIAFNFAVLFTEDLRGWFLQRRARRVGREVEALLAQDANQGASPLLAGRNARLQRYVSTLAGLEALDHALEALRERDSEQTQACLVGIAPVLERVALAWKGERALERAYLCSVLRRWYVVRPVPGRLLHALTLLACDGSFYVRQNALEALAALGSADALAEALRLMRASGEYHHPRLITEALLAFAGDADELAFTLSAELGTFDADVQVAIVNWLRMSNKGDRDGLLMLMDSPDADVEVRLACMRYFMTNPWGKALASLVRYASDPIAGQWQFRAVAATALGSYNAPESIKALEGCLTSSVWFVRRNAAVSLRRLGLGGGEALVAADGDAYARDMVRYQWGLGGEGA